MDTNAPSSLYVGRSTTPTLTTVSTVPGSLVDAASSFLSAVSLDGTITSTVKINGVAKSVAQAVPRTAFPTTPTTDLPITGKAALAPLGPKAASTTTYTAADVVTTLNFYKADGTSAGSFSDIPCTLTSTSGTTVDTVTAVKSATATTATVAYTKAKKTVKATATVRATSGVTPTGRVTFALYKGAKKIRTLAANLAGGRAAATFTRISVKGGYRVIETYAGSAASNGSKAQKAFTVR
jgi:hypothetical protein